MGAAVTARILQFPVRGPFVVRVTWIDGAWLVVCRQHGWIFGSEREAIDDAVRIAAGFGVALAVAGARS
jgi:hypothetical protein